jgi:hypothetical protein
VRAAITALPGTLEVTYNPQENLFTVLVDDQQTAVEDILAAVYIAGKQAGQNYLPEMIS